MPDDDAEAVLARFNHYAETEVLPRLRENAPEASIVTEVEAAAATFPSVLMRFEGNFSGPEKRKSNGSTLT